MTLVMAAGPAPVVSLSLDVEAVQAEPEVTVASPCPQSLEDIVGVEMEVDMAAEAV